MAQTESMETKPGVIGYFQEVIAEMKKVTWPTREDTIRLTGVVIVISLIIGLYIGIIDIALAAGLEFLTNR